MPHKRNRVTCPTDRRTVSYRTMPCAPGSKNRTSGAAVEADPEIRAVLNPTRSPKASRCRASCETSMPFSAVFSID